MTVSNENSKCTLGTEELKNEVYRTLRVMNFDISFWNKLMTSSYHNFESSSLFTSAEFKTEGIEESSQ